MQIELIAFPRAAGCVLASFVLNSLFAPAKRAHFVHYVSTILATQWLSASPCLQVNTFPNFVVMLLISLPISENTVQVGVLLVMVFGGIVDL